MWCVFVSVYLYEKNIACHRVTWFNANVRFASCFAFTVIVKIILLYFIKSKVLREILCVYMHIRCNLFCWNQSWSTSLQALCLVLGCKVVSFPMPSRQIELHWLSYESLRSSVPRPASPMTSAPRIKSDHNQNLFTYVKCPTFVMFF